MLTANTQTAMSTVMRTIGASPVSAASPQDRGNAGSSPLSADVNALFEQAEPTLNDLRERKFDRAAAEARLRDLGVQDNRLNFTKEEYTAEEMARNWNRYMTSENAAAYLRTQGLSDAGDKNSRLARALVQ